jgi:hypothetical protein
MCRDARYVGGRMDAQETTGAIGDGAIAPKRRSYERNTPQQ